MEGIVSKRIDQPYKPGERGTWVKSKCLNRARVCDRRLDKSEGFWGAPLGLAIAWLLHARWSADICWPCWHRHVARDIEDAAWQAETSNR